MSEPRCALISAEQDEPLLGTAPEASSFLLVEVRAGWAGKILATELPPAVHDFLAQAETTLPGLRLQFIRAPKRTRGPIAVYLCRVGEFVSRLEIADLSELPLLDLAGWLATGTHAGAVRQAEALTLVCTHGRRDVCCALLGNPVYEALVAASPAQTAEDLPTVWQASHLGGHRFAPVVVSLPDGHCYGRLGVDEAAELLRARERGEVHDPRRLRGCTSDAPWAQAASVAYRIEADERGFGAVTRDPHLHDVDGVLHVTLHTRQGEVRLALEPEVRGTLSRPASCGERPTPVTTWRVTFAH